MAGRSDAGAGRAGCPICGRPPADASRPFCSPRCRMVDLGRWLDGRYRIPTPEAPGGDDGFADGFADDGPVNPGAGRPDRW